MQLVKIVFKNSYFSMEYTSAITFTSLAVILHIVDTLHFS